METTTTTKYSNWLHVGSLRKYKLLSQAGKFIQQQHQSLVYVTFEKINLCLFH